MLLCNRVDQARGSPRSHLLLAFWSLRPAEAKGKADREKERIREKGILENKHRSTKGGIREERRKPAIMFAENKSMP